MEKEIILKKKQEKQKKYLKNWRIQNKEKVSEYNKTHRPHGHAYYVKNKEQIKEYQRKYSQTIRGKYTSYKNRSKSRGLIFSLTLSEFEDITALPCNYCGDISGGIDRIDSSIGYIHGNIVPCCEQCNTMKLDYTVTEFIEKCNKIISYYK